MGFSWKSEADTSEWVSFFPSKSRVIICILANIIHMNKNSF